MTCSSPSDRISVTRRRRGARPARSQTSVCASACAPPPGPVSGAVAGEDEVVVLLRPVAGEALRVGVGDHAIRAALALEALEAPAARRLVLGPILPHHADELPVARDPGTVLVL